MEPIHEEYQYLNLLKQIMEDGHQKNDRTGVGTKSIFGAQMRFKLTNSFPLFTTKKVFFKGIQEELFWFINGFTDSKLLEQKGVNIWKGNSSREFLDNHTPPLKYPEGEVGPVYGYQWRNWNGLYEASGMSSEFSVEETEEGFRYAPSDAAYTIKKEMDGLDQLAKVVERIKKNPDDRRLIVSAWNPEQIDKMALPPCHVMYQFYVADSKLSCHIYQRSADMGLGVPFNIASYALLTYIIAEICDLNRGDLIWSAGDTHIYNNHFDQCREQMTREPRPFPTLSFNRRLYRLEDIVSSKADDFTLNGYDPHPPIKMDMAI